MNTRFGMKRSRGVGTIVSWTHDGVPISDRFDDVYYSRDDPVGEVKHTFLKGVDFEALCSSRKRLVVGETGFGTGLNFLEARRVWERRALPGNTFDWISVEKFPMSVDDMRKAHLRFGECYATLAEELRRAWPGDVPGVHRVQLCRGRIRLILLIGDVAEMLRAQNFCADAWFLDGFDPKKNEEMWTDDTIREVTRLSAPHRTCLATFTVAGTVRRGLKRYGWDVKKADGFGRKRECLRATLTSSSSSLSRVEEPWYAPPEPISTDASVVVLGAGLAGLATMRALRESAGIRAKLLSFRTKVMSSELPFALIAPKLNRGDDAYSAFNRQIYHDAVRVLDTLDENVWVCRSRRRGLLIPHYNCEDRIREQQSLVKKLEWPDAELSLLSRDEVRHRTHGRHAASGGLWLPRAGTVDTSRLRESLLTDDDEHESLDAPVAALESHPNGTISLIDVHGKVVSTSDYVIVATGASSANLLPPNVQGSKHAIRRSMGRVLFVEELANSSMVPQMSTLRMRQQGGGYVTTSDDHGSFVVGADVRRLRRDEHDSLMEEESIASDDVLLERLRRSLSIYPENVRRASVWCGVRSDTIDHMPMAGPIQDGTFFTDEYANLARGRSTVSSMRRARYEGGLYALTGLGSRGFQCAFLLADTIAATMSGRPLALEESVRCALLPSRFQVRDMVRGVA